jgi:RNA recognition motif-containing protein
MKANDGKTNLALYGKVGAPSRELLKSLTETAPYKRRIKEMNGEKKDTTVERQNVYSGGAPDMLAKVSKTLFITGVSESTTDNDLQKYFEVWGDIKSAITIPKKNCAFVTFEDKASSQNAFQSCKGGFTLKETVCRIHYAKSKAQGPSKTVLTHMDDSKAEARPEKGKARKIPPPPPGSSNIIYPSQLAQSKSFAMDRNNN